MPPEPSQPDRAEIIEEIRAILRLPLSSNLRGDDVIELISGCDDGTRVRLLDLYVALRELDDANGRPVDSFG